MLGLRPMGVFDLTSTAMSASFVGPDEKPDFAPYAVVPTQSIYELNPKVSGLTGAAR